MTFSRTLLASSSTLTFVLIGLMPAYCQEARGAGEPAVQLAQRGDEGGDRRRGQRKPDATEAEQPDAAPQGRATGGERPRRRERGGDQERARGPAPGGGDAAAPAGGPERTQRQQGREPDRRQRRDDGAARQEAERQRQLQEQQARERDRRQKQEAEAARQNAERQKQQQEQQARERRQKQEAEAARQNAERQRQLQEQQARERDRRQRPDDGAGRQNTERQRQFQDQQRARDLDRRQRQDDGAARQEAERQRQLQDQQARDRDRRQRPDGDRRGPRPQQKFDRAKADQEFERARRDAQQKSGRGPAETWRPSAVNKFEELRKGRKTREVGSRDIITEPDKRVIVRDENRTFIRHDESARLARKGREVRRERRKDGTWLVITAGLAGALIYSLQDDDGRVVRRSRRDRDGREHVLFDDRRHYRGGGGFGSDYRPAYIDLPPPVVRIPRDRYIVEYDRASPEDIYEALNAPPIEDLDRHYSLDEVRQNYTILERMRRVDLDAINFAFASWEVGEDQYPKLERIARAMLRVLDRSPNELFLIEGHTDAVGNEIDNLSLSDRRAEMVATILTDVFDIPPENLATQGYGEGYLKELTDGPSRINRRVGVRRITPLLAREGWNDPY